MYDINKIIANVEQQRLEISQGTRDPKQYSKRKPPVREYKVPDGYKPSAGPILISPEDTYGT